MEIFFKQIINGRGKYLQINKYSCIIYVCVHNIYYIYINEYIYVYGQFH